MSDLYDKFVGVALSLEIKVYRPGGEAKDILDLYTEISAIMNYQPRHRKDGPCSTSTTG